MINKYRISTFEDIQNLRWTYEKYDIIIIVLNPKIANNYFKFSIKYSLRALKNDGYLDICFSKSFFNRIIMNLTIYKNELFKSIGDNAIDMLVKERSGFQVLRLKKTSQTLEDNRISFGIIVSGSQNEDTLIFRSVQSINDSINNANLQSESEILVCGPGDAKMRLENLLRNFHIKYIIFDQVQTQTGRFLISKKKNFLIDKCIYPKVIIAHARILFPSNFVSKINDKIFEIATPRVILKSTGENYLDMKFYENGNIIDSCNQALFTNFSNQNKYKIQKRFLPYIDGGLFLINKQLVKEKTYLNNHLAWNEAEDVDMAIRMNSLGYLIEYFDDIVCKSQTDKREKKNLLNYLHSYIMNILNKLYRAFRCCIK